jgi:hypothetical protein
MGDPWNVFALDEVRARTGLIIEPAVATEAEIRKALNEHYGAVGSIEDLLKSIDEVGSLETGAGKPDIKKLLGIVEEPLVIRLVNLIMMQAVRERASDVHIEPEEETLKIRLRVDGMLHEIDAPPKHLQSAIISRLKIMADLDIAERRSPQDGRFTIKMEGRQMNIGSSGKILAGRKTISGGSPDNELLDMVEALFMQVCDILDMHLYSLQIGIDVMKDSGQLAMEYRKLFDDDLGNRGSFYVFDHNRIYIASTDFKATVLGHEMAHAIISHYFVVQPPVKIQEVLAGYVEYNLRKMQN